MEKSLAMPDIVEAMKRRGRTKVVARSWSHRVRPSTRRVRAENFAALHNHESEPGLTGLSATGTVGDIAWYAVEPTSGNGSTTGAVPVTVVFIHGYGLSAESWYAQVRDAADAGARCLLVDLRGHGLSGRVPAAQCTLDGAGDDVLAVIAEQAADGPLVIVGHSLGGMVAQNVIRRAPESVYERITGVLLVATSMQPFARTGAAALLRSRAAHALYDAAQRLPGRVNHARREVAEFIAPVFATLLTGFPQMEQLQFHVDMMMDTPLDSFVGFFDDLIEHDEYAAAGRLGALPGIVMVGSLDIVTPRSQADEILKHWPAAELVEVDGAGHMVILEEPDQVTAALRRLLPDG